MNLAKLEEIMMNICANFFAKFDPFHAFISSSVYLFLIKFEACEIWYVTMNLAKLKKLMRFFGEFDPIANL